MNETTNIKKPSAAQIAGSRCCANVLYLTLKKKWFDMILHGGKKEEYREIKEYWLKRFFRYNSTWELDQNMIDEVIYELNFKTYTIKEFSKGFDWDLKKFDFICFRNGYSKDAPEIWCGCNGVRIDKAKPEWSDNVSGNFFVIELGQILAFPIELQ